MNTGLAWRKRTDTKLAFLASFHDYFHRARVREKTPSTSFVRSGRNTIAARGASMNVTDDLLFDKLGSSSTSPFSWCVPRRPVNPPKCVGCAGKRGQLSVLVVTDQLDAVQCDMDKSERTVKTERSKRYAFKLPKM